VSGKPGRGPVANWQAGQSPASGKAGKRSLRIPRTLYRLTIYFLITLAISILVYKAFQKRPDLLVGAVELVSETSTNVGGPTLAIKPPRAEVLRYYLEVVSPSNKAGDVVTRANGLMPLDGGTKFKFHLTSAEGAYLYILALGKNGVPQTFLTAQ